MGKDDAQPSVSVKVSGSCGGCVEYSSTSIATYKPQESRCDPSALQIVISRVKPALEQVYICELSLKPCTLSMQDCLRLLNYLSLVGIELATPSDAAFDTA